MHRRKFFLMPVALGSLLTSVRTPAQDAARRSARIPVTFSKRAVGARPLYLNIDRLAPGNIAVQVDLWLRLDIDPPPAGGVAIRPSIRIFEDSLSGRRPILNSDDIEGKSAPNSNEVHITGTATGVNHNDVFRPLMLEFGIKLATYFNPAAQSGATVSTVQGKDSVLVVTTG
jgi:hypothetical protein